MTTETSVVETVKPHQWTDGGTKVLVLRRCEPSLISTNSFKYPESGEVVCPDWDPSPVCGGGLHGWPWGMGLGEGSGYDIIGDKWLVIAAMPDDVVGELAKGWKCKLQRGEVVYCGSFSAAWAIVNSGRHRLIDAMAKPGVPDSSSGNSSKAASSGNYSKAASSGDSSTAASSGDSSTAETQGKDTAAAVVGHGGKVKVGENGAFAIAYFTKDEGYRFLTGKVGENGIKADTWYCVENGELKECK